MRNRILLSGATLLGLLACSPADDGPTGVPAPTQNVGLVEFSADTRIMESFPVQLATDVTARNTGPTTADVVFPDGCVVMLRVYDNAQRAGKPVWDQARIAACTMAVIEVPIPGGGAELFRGGVGAGHILGDSLPDARYWLSAVLRPNRDTVEVTAGEADLAVPR